MADKNELFERMKKLFSERDLAVNKDQAEKFFIFYNLLVKHNDEFDLTRMKSFEDIIIKHFIDSIYILNICEIPSTLIDIGTGAGFPGIPIKIMRPGLPVILAEPRKKRVQFMKMAIEELGIKDVDIYPHMVTDKSFFNINGVITRALENIDNTLSRVSHFLPAGGTVIFMKGDDIESDMENISEENINLYKLINKIDYKLPRTTYRRELLIYEKSLSRIKKTYKIFINTNETIGMPITSTENKKYKALKELLVPRGIKEYNKTIVSGNKILNDIIDDGKIIKEDLIIYDGYSADDSGRIDLISKFDKIGKLLILKKSLYSDIDLFNTLSPLLVVSLPEIAEWDMEISRGLNLVIPFQDPVNVGSIIRSAAGFSVKKIILLKEAANPYHPKSIRSSGGAVFKYIFEKGPSLETLIEIINTKSIPMVTLDSSGKNIKEFHFPESFLLLPGIEGPGIPVELKKNSLSIPISDSINSYNAAIAASIVIYEWFRRSF